MIARLLKADRVTVLPAIAAMIGLIAVADWRVGNRASLGVFYILPTMLGATVMNRVEIVALALLCAFLKSCFDLPSPPVEAIIRFVFAVLAYVTSGLFVIAVIKTREQALEHRSKIGIEQDLRKEAQDQLRDLVESSPAGILTLDASGVVLAANNSANEMFGIQEPESMRGRRIGRYLPVLADALELASGAEGLRTSAQSQGRRDGGEIFLANTWFSSYASPLGLRLAAIVVDSSEEMRDREEENLRQVLNVNQILVAAVSHEMRNLCSAISLVCSNMENRLALGTDEDFRGLTGLVQALERIASLELAARSTESLEDVALREVLDHLRIVIEPAWREIEGRLRWDMPPETPVVLAERHGLLQVFLNLARNSHRALLTSETRELAISVIVEGGRVKVEFRDTGPGISAPERLFAPFQRGSDGAGLGLHISRGIMRSFGGDLRFEPLGVGSRFIVELEAAQRVLQTWPT